MIAVDIDGVVADSEPWLVKEIEERSGITLKFNNPRTFDFLARVDIDVDDCLRYIRDALVKYKDDIEVHDRNDTILALALLQKTYGKIYFVTARANGNVSDATHYWLKRNFGTCLNYELHSLGECANKKMWMYDNGINTIIEDRLKTVNEVGSSYTSTYLINREWNIGRPSNDHVIRVYSLLEAVDHHLGTNNV